MFRKLSVFLLPAAIFFFAGIAGVAEAARQTFGDAFSAEVPGGWQVEEGGDAAVSVIFSAPDDSARLWVMVSDEAGFALGEVAAEIASAVNGSEPVEDEAGNFIFLIGSWDGLDGLGLVTAREGKFLSMLVLGETPALEALINSIQFAETNRTFNIHDNYSLSIDVPAGWQVHEGDNSVTFTAPDESAALSIIWGEMGGRTLGNIAGDLSETLAGSAPEEDEDGAFTFTFTDEAGLDSNVFVTGDGEGYVVFLVHGDHPQMEALFNSIDESGR